MTEPLHGHAGSSFNFTKEIGQRGLNPRQLLIITLLGLLVLFDGTDNQLLGLVAHPMADHLGVPVASFGVVFSINLVGAIVGALGLTALADQTFGRKAVVIAGMSLAGLGTMLTALAPSYEALLAIRFITGVGLGAALPTAISLAAEWSPKRHSRLVISLMIAFVPLGSLVGGLLGRVVMPEFGWHTLLYVSGTATLLLTVLTAIFVPESMTFLVRRRHDRVAAIAAVRTVFKTVNVQAVSVDKDPEDTSDARKPVASLFKGSMWRLTLLFWVAFIMNQAILYFVINWAPALLLSSGMSQTAGMDAAAMFGLGGALGTIAQGWLTTRFNLYKVMAVEILIYVAAMVALPITLGSPHLAPATIFVVAATICAYHAGFIMVILETYPEAIRNTGFGWTFGVGRVGASTAPILVGFLLGIGWNAAMIFFVGAIPGIISGVALLWVYLVSKGFEARASGSAMRPI